MRSPSGRRRMAELHTGVRSRGALARALRLLGIVAVLCGIALLAIPVATDWMGATEAGQVISQVTSSYDEMDEPGRQGLLDQATRWNATLASGGRTDEAEGLLPYDDQLACDDMVGTMMSWVDIPRISTRLPIYHHASHEVLAAGVGHIEWSALPVGGDGTRCVLSAHSGMQDTRMFDDIRELAEGDTFTLWTLSHPYSYRVCDIRVIEPDDTDALQPEAGRDLCTLVTCTPYGVNTHRLLVTGERCEDAVTGGVDAGLLSSVAPYVNRRTAPLMAGIALLMLVLIIVLVARAVAKRRGRRC